VSSSAAFELLICEILNVLYNDGKIDFVTKALIAQFAENKYFGKPSGLMDQLTISRGGVSYMDFEDAVHPSSFSVEWKFENITPIIINCGGDHCNLTDEYAAIREDMKKVSAALGKECLREVDEKIFYDNIALLHKRCGGRAVLRAKHFFEENIRVKKALAAINNNDEKLFIDCINASGVSSYEQLQNCYPAFDREQNIPLALQLANTRDCVKAARVHGGGFAGTILVFADKEKADGFIDYMAGIFGRENIFSLSMRGLGATMLEV
jgi:galactokinase